MTLFLPTFQNSYLECQFNFKEVNIMSNNISNISNNDSDTVLSKQLYNVNAAVYICGVRLNVCEFMDKHTEAVSKMERAMEKLSKCDEKKASHYKKQISKYGRKASEFQDTVDFNDYLTIEFYSDKTQPWLKDDNLSYEEKDIIDIIARELELYPYSVDEELAA